VARDRFGDRSQGPRARGLIALIILCFLAGACQSESLGKTRDGQEVSGRRRFTDDTTFLVVVSSDPRRCKRPCRQAWVNVRITNTGTLVRYAVCRAKAFDAGGRVLHSGKLIVSFPAGPLLEPGETLKQEVPWPTPPRPHMERPSHYEGACRAAVWDGEVPI
jgi:hypothetical protein